MKISNVIMIGAVPLLATGAAFAQIGYMMNGSLWSGGWMGGYGGPWIPLLFLVVLVALVVWIVRQKNQ